MVPTIGGPAAPQTPLLYRGAAPPGPPAIPLMAKEHEARLASNKISNHTCSADHYSIDMQHKYCGDRYDIYRIQSRSATTS